MLGLNQAVWICEVKMHLAGVIRIRVGAELEGDISNVIEALIHKH